jgi:hypothetical protein
MHNAACLINEAMGHIERLGFPGSPELWELRNSWVRVLWETQDYVRNLTDAYKEYLYDRGKL